MSGFRYQIHQINQGGKKSTTLSTPEHIQLYFSFRGKDKFQYFFNFPILASM